MGNPIDLLRPPKPPAPPQTYVADDGTVWYSEAERQQHNTEIAQQTQRSEARQRGYFGDFGGGGYNRFLQSYVADPRDPNGAWVAKNDAVYDRYGNDVSAFRADARSKGYTGYFGKGYYDNWQAQQNAAHKQNEADAATQRQIDDIAAQRESDREFYETEVQRIRDERTEIESRQPVVPNDAPAPQTARRAMLQRMAGRRSLLSRNALGYTQGLGT